MTAASGYLMSLVLLACFIMRATLSQGTLCHRQVLLSRTAIQTKHARK